MIIETFLSHLLSMRLTMNELSVLLELAHDDFSRGDILSNPNRCPINTYSASSLTRTLQKLSARNPAVISTYLDSNNHTIYRLVEKVERNSSYYIYEPILKSIRHSLVLTVNTMRVALQILINRNEFSTTRFLANQLNLDPDYLAATVLSRMIVIGLVKAKFAEMKIENINSTDRDKFPLHVVSLNMNWKGTASITLL